MKIERFVYKSSVDAFTYLIVFVLSVIVPTIASLILDSAFLLVITILINAISLVREYALLIQYEKVSFRFWIERLIGIALSVVIAVYGVVALFFMANDIGIEVFKVLNVIFSVLFLFPGVIATLEGILYVREDFSANVVNDSITVATKTAIDV